MKGKVVKYFNDKGYGFIRDEESNTRFFHISNLIKPDDEIRLGDLVKFMPDSNKKGLACLDVRVLKSNNKSFISINNTNIKASNIKEFGISQSDEVKALKVPIYKLNPEYYKTKERAGKNIFKKLFLPEKYIRTGTFEQILEKEFEKFTIQGNEFRDSRKVYELPFILVKQSKTKNIKFDEYSTRIDKDEAEFVYWKYLYITTYQNDNYQFYEYSIEIEEVLSQLKELVNY